MYVSILRYISIYTYSHPYICIHTYIYCQWYQCMWRYCITRNIYDCNFGSSAHARIHVAQAEVSIIRTRVGFTNPSPIKRWRWTDTSVSKTSYILDFGVRLGQSFQVIQGSPCFGPSNPLLWRPGSHSCVPLGSQCCVGLDPSFASVSQDSCGWPPCLLHQ